RENVKGSIVPLPRVSARRCAGRPLRENSSRFPRSVEVVSQKATLPVAFSANDGADYRSGVHSHRALHGINPTAAARLHMAVPPIREDGATERNTTWRG